MKFICILLLLFINTLSIRVEYGQYSDKELLNVQQSSVSLDEDLGLQLSAIPEKLFAGQLHYSRIPVQYWQHRILMVKSLGLNALSVYIMWNYHEVAKGVFDYETGNKNLTKFLSLCKKHQMHVLIRPGPYVCAEWDFGGLPARLLGINGLVIRSDNKIYLNQVSIYFSSLAPLLKPYLAQSGGPIILLQIENQFGFYGTDKKYIQALRNMWKQEKIVVDQYYVDTVSNINKNHWIGANIGVNGAVKQADYDYAKSLSKKAFIFGGQIYSGWLTHWGEGWAGKSLENVMKEYKFLMENNHSFSMYMVHGGTNFGLTAGANFGLGAKNQTENVYQGDITSYDYNAPINQQGSPTPKFFALKQYLSEFISWQVPTVPQALATIQIPSFSPSFYSTLFSSLRTPDFTNLPSSGSSLTFQSDILKMYNQGMVLYKTTLQRKTYYMTIQVNDFAIVYLDGKQYTILDRSVRNVHKLMIKCEAQEGCQFKILVQAMGHINFAHDMEKDRKGLFEIRDDVQTDFKWDVYRVRLDGRVLQDFGKSQPNSNQDTKNSPSFFRSQLNLQETADTYFNMSGYIKGYLWVNGINLGRYWTEKGPQKKLFCPGVWLRKGKNEIIVLDLLQSQSKPISGEKWLQ